MVEQPGFFDHMFMPFRKFVDFRGRATRTEFWSFQLLLVVIIMALFWIPELFYNADLPFSDELSDVFFSSYWLFLLVILTPELAVTVRRLHDINVSGWLVLIYLIPLGVIVLILMMFGSTYPGKNKWGRNPKEPREADISDHLIIE